MQRGAAPPLGRPFRPSEPERASSDDAAVRATDADAVQSRLSAIASGYLPPDPYAGLLASPGARRPLLINLGTALRSSEVDEAVHRFLARGGVFDGDEHASDGAEHSWVTQKTVQREE